MLQRGIVGAITELLKQHPARRQIQAVMVGTTHFTNALLERKELSPTAVMRLSLPATQLLPPLVDCPDELKDAIGGLTYMVEGGNEFDGREISPLDRDGIRAAVRDFHSQGVRSVAVSGVFSPVDPSHEKEAAAIIREEAPDVRVCMSHENGRMGLLERENAADAERLPCRCRARHYARHRGRAQSAWHTRAPVHEPERRDADGYIVRITVSGVDHIIGADEQHARRGVSFGRYGRHSG